MKLNENLDIFFKGEFSITAELFSENSPLTEIDGIIDNQYVPVFDELQVEGRKIAFLVDSSNLEDIHHGDELIIEEITYEIVGIQPQDDGKITYLILKEKDG